MPQTRPRLDCCVVCHLVQPIAAMWHPNCSLQQQNMLRSLVFAKHGVEWLTRISCSPAATGVASSCGSAVLADSQHIFACHTLASHHSRDHIMAGLVTASQASTGAGEGVKRPHEAEDQPKGEGSSKKHRQDLANLPTRQYLDQTVVPILLQVTIVK